MEAELPGYSEAPSSSAAGTSSGTAQAGSQHTLSLQDKKGLPWLTLRINSRASTPASPPIFHEGDVISGQLDFDIPKPTSIKGIFIKIAAGTTSIGQEEHIFLNPKTAIWTPYMALPDGPKVAKFSKGKYSWPLSLTLPAEVEVQDQKTKKKFPLPASFSERASSGCVDYKLTVTVKRGIFRTNQTLATAFAYIPVTRPELPSRMLQKALKENIPLIGPEGDPDGWHTLPSVIIQGKLFDSYTAEVTFSLALAKPLTYGRGTAMPLWLILTGNDERALDLLSSPRAIRLLLVRSLATGTDATLDSDNRTDNRFSENVVRAVFWPPENSSAQGQRVLQGEVDLKSDLVPTTVFPRFTVQYHLDFQPFEVAGFVASASKDEPLLRQEVTIATFPALGVLLRSHAPPGYVQDPSADYNTSVGLLENGNQRFFPHHGGLGGM